MCLNEICAVCTFMEWIRIWRDDSGNLTYLISTLYLTQICHIMRAVVNATHVTSTTLVVLFKILTTNKLCWLHLYVCIIYIFLGNGIYFFLLYFIYFILSIQLVMLGMGVGLRDPKNIYKLISNLCLYDPPNQKKGFFCTFKCCLIIPTYKYWNYLGKFDFTKSRLVQFQSN